MKPPEAAPAKPKRESRALWIWVTAAFVILASAWALLIVIATRNQPELVPLESSTSAEP